MILDMPHVAARGSHNDVLLFPVLYLYRHCIELKLKDLLLLGIRNLIDEAAADKILDEDEGITGEHRLWPVGIRRRNFSHSYQNDPQLKVAESMINDLHQIDKDGQTLRYDRVKGTSSTPTPEVQAFR